MLSGRIIFCAAGFFSLVSWRKAVAKQIEMKYPLRFIQISQRVFLRGRVRVGDYLFQATATYSFAPLNLKFLTLML